MIEKKEINKLTTGCSVEVYGRIVESQGKQKVEPITKGLGGIMKGIVDLFKTNKKDEKTLD